MISGLLGSTASWNPSAPSGRPTPRCHVRPSSLERYTPMPAVLSKPKAGSPVSASTSPPLAELQATEPTTWVGRLSPIERQAPAAVVALPHAAVDRRGVQAPGR